LEIEDMEVGDSEFNEEFMRIILPTLDWNGVLLAASSVDFDGLPPTFNLPSLDDIDFLRAVHKLLLDIHVLKGKLTCPESGRVFLIENGIADMNIPEVDA
jgi:multifunctional methyltransferase subunit TRM112